MYGGPYDVDSHGFKMRVAMEMGSLGKFLTGFPEAEEAMLAFPPPNRETDPLMWELQGYVVLRALPRLLAKHQGLPVRPIVILETGAGRGGLTLHLDNYLKETGSAGKYAMHATDNKSWDVRDALILVEALDYKAALAKYQPDIVLTSWLPEGDWTPDYRATASVQEYLLIGEPFDGCCGGWDAHDWEEPRHDAATGWTLPAEGQQLVDGFRIAHLEKVSEQQLCRTDNICPWLPFNDRHSQTFAFYRVTT
ncbi:hypothetical protein WJX72_001354 [[Myrmecia] bisecta]|uniref:Uncharacterized protein n=1 Tax=[Myrmecia] bisecta TaxID=41462 RepID=A0AAW1P4Q9_9CHLO